MAKKKKIRIPKPVFTQAVPDLSEAPIVCGECHDEYLDCSVCEEPIEEDDKMVCESVVNKGTNPQIVRVHYHEKCYLYEKGKKSNLTIVLTKGDRMIVAVNGDGQMDIEDISPKTLKEFKKFILEHVEEEENVEEVQGVAGKKKDSKDS